MVSLKPVVNRLDKQRLQPYLDDNGMPPAYRLRRLLEAARAVDPAAVPPDVVTMNSRVEVRDPRDDSVETYLLAYPDHEGGEIVTVSVLSPMGAALLAASEGQEVVYPGARGMRRLIVENLVYQPERAGDLNL